MHGRAKRDGVRIIVYGPTSRAVSHSEQEGVSNGTLNWIIGLDYWTQLYYIYVHVYVNQCNSVDRLQ